ncbi:MAG: hypothetical protein N3D74_04805 [Caldisericia bacterium]|nr:hypothetical protein [Caldisericia bacterium]
MSFNDFEEILKNLSKLEKLSNEEKEKIFKYILKKERKTNLILISILIFTSIFLILFIPFKTNLFDPVYILIENESIKKLQLNLELYLSNPLILIQIIYYLLAIFMIAFLFVFIRIKFFLKGGNGE